MIGSVGRRRVARAAAALLAVTAVGLVRCGGDEEARPRRGEHASAAGMAVERAPELGPDDAVIGAIRVTLETGTDNPVLVWFDNQRHQVSRTPARDFVPGASVRAVLTGSGMPRTLGALRRSSILLTLHLDRASIGASWYCASARVEVRLEGVETYRTYLEARDIGWLSQDEPPRRSPAYALQ